MPALPWQHFSGSHFIGYCAVPIGILYSPSTSPTQPLVKLEFSSSSLRFWVQLNFFESYVTSKSLKFFIAWFWKWQIFIAKSCLLLLEIQSGSRRIHLQSQIPTSLVHSLFLFLPFTLLAGDISVLGFFFVYVYTDARIIPLILSLVLGI